MAWEGVKKIFIGAFQAIWNFTNLTFIGGLKKGIVNLVTSMLKSWKTWVDDAIKFFQNFWTNCKTIIGNIKSFFKGFVDDLALWWDRFCMNMALRWVKFKDDVIKAGKQAWQGIKDAFTGAVDWFSRVIITPIINRFQEIKNAFKQGITQGLKAVLNAVRAPINELIGGLNAVKNKIPGVAGLVPNIPKIPAFAQGGITAGPMLAMVGDNPGGKEVIAPLDRLQSMLMNSVIQAMQMSNTGGNGNSSDVILNIDGRSFARIVKPFLDKEQSRVGADVRIRTI